MSKLNLGEAISELDHLRKLVFAIQWLCEDVCEGCKYTDICKTCRIDLLKRLILDIQEVGE